MMQPLKRFIQNALYYTGTTHRVNKLTPCGRLPCYCILREDLKKYDGKYLKCYDTWMEFNKKK